MSYTVQQGFGSTDVLVSLRDIAFGGAVKSYRLMPKERQYTPEAFVAMVLPKAIELLKKEDGRIKFSLSIRVGYAKPREHDDRSINSTFMSRAHIVHPSDDPGRAVEEEAVTLLQRAEDFDEAGSGWVYGQFFLMDVHIAQIDLSGTDDSSSSSSDSEDDYDY